MSVDLDVILLAPHEAAIRQLLTDGNGAERSGYMLFGTAAIAQDPWSKAPRTRLISHHAEPVAGADQVSSSPQHVTWQTDGFMGLLGRAANQTLIPGIVHTHPSGAAVFSDQDNRNEAELARTAILKGLPGLVSVLVAGNGDLAVRLWRSAVDSAPIPRVLYVGPRLALTATTDATPMFLDRQTRLFGESGNEQIVSSRCGIVGGGGTGSGVLPLLMRLGIRESVLIEKDTVDLTNLNRLHGARRSDADDEQPKASVHLRTVSEACLGMQLITVDAWAGDSASWDALKACDVIFSCTDDHAGRLFLNRFARYYGIPVIDVGLAMKRRSTSTYDLFARVSTLVPGHACLLCGGYIDPVRAREESLRRTDPRGYEELKDEAYVIGDGDPSPAVVTFTTEAASMAVNEWLAGLCGITWDQRMVSTRIRRFHARDDRFPHNESRAGCPACDASQTLGRGDVDPFIGRVT